MLELDDVWPQMITAAGERAAAQGRQHVADYLRLKATNDAIRTTAVAWLIDATIAVAAPELGRDPLLGIEREEPYRFQFGTSQMVGSLIRMDRGVRCLMLEAGWVRTPTDGIMRHGALAVARVSHFGMPLSGAELRLVRAEPMPQWIDADASIVDTAYIQRHFDLFMQRTRQS